MEQDIQRRETRIDAEDFGWMIGRSIELVFSEPHTWWFCFSGGGTAGVDGGTWRMLGPESMIACSEDHGHTFGLPAPWSALDAVKPFLSKAVVATVAVRARAPDLVIGLSNGCAVELFTNSRGYECWEATDPAGRRVCVRGDRSTAVQTPPRT